MAEWKTRRGQHGRGWRRSTPGHLPSLLVFALGLATTQALHLRWLPLGDSITWGCGNGILPHVPGGGCERDAGSYRIPAAMALEQWNISVQTVGSLTAGPASAPDVWQHHEGHPGWTAPQINAIAPAWSKLQPDLVTVLLGTNDCGNSSRTAGADASYPIESMRVLLDTISAKLPAAKVLVASTLAMRSSVRAGADAACGRNLNAAIPGLLRCVCGGAAWPGHYYCDTG